MSVLLTGGAGFIGSHIAVELINAGLDPIIADDFSNSSPDVIDRLYAITSKRIPCYEINVADAPSVSRILKETPSMRSYTAPGSRPLANR